MFEPKARLALSALLLTTAFAVACDPNDPDPNPTPTPTGPIELVGEWHSGFGGVEVITKERWGTAAIVTHDNQANSAVLKNADDDLFYPGKFSKVVWTEPVGGRLHYCTLDFGLESEAEARGTTKVADPTAPDVGGCGGFPWTALSPTFELTGAYTSNFGTQETIDSDAWAISGAGYETVQKVVEFDNQTNTAILQNPEDDAFYPSKFAKVVYTEKSGGKLHYCVVDFGRDTAADARTSTQTADRAALGTDGCGGFAWTELTEGSGG